MPEVAEKPQDQTKPAEPEGPIVNTKTKFFFKKRKEKDATGAVVMVNEVDKDGKPTGKMVEKVIPAAEPVDIEIPLLTLSGVAEILNGGDEKQSKLIVEAVNNVILEQARDAVNNNPEEVRKNGIDATTLTWAHIANLPPAQRKGPGISEETWEAFKADYISVMQHHGKTKEKAETGAKLLAARFQPVKLNKTVVRALKDNLSTWFANTASAEEFQDVYESLASKADTLLEQDEDALAAAV
jgi:hypothetical protein